MIKKIKKIYHTIRYYYYDWQSKRIAKLYWKELEKKEEEENDNK